MSTEARDVSRKDPPKTRRTDIIDAAARVFHEKGYDATTIQEIATEVGILKGSLYYYIDSKEDLLYEILEQSWVDADRNLEQVGALDGDPLMKIRMFVTLHVKFSIDNLEKYAVYYRDLRSLGAERRSVIAQKRKRYDGFLVGLIEEGQEGGLVCPDLNARIAAAGIFGMMNGIYDWYRRREGWSAEKLADEYADMALAGLHCDPATHRTGHRRALGSLSGD
jgi:AcrR family transcriptional regulator